MQRIANHLNQASDRLWDLRRRRFRNRHWLALGRSGLFLVQR